MGIEVSEEAAEVVKEAVMEDQRSFKKGDVLDVETEVTSEEIVQKEIAAEEVHQEEETDVTGIETITDATKHLVAVPQDHLIEVKTSSGQQLEEEIIQAHQRGRSLVLL